MKQKTMMRFCILPADSEIIWEKLKEMKTLQYIAFPYAVFKPAEHTGMRWQAGQTSRFYFRLFGLIPLGIHTITIKTFDAETKTIISQEHNRFVPRWEHTICLKKQSGGTRYTDEVTIAAGWKTPFVFLWAKAFYAHRQKKWLRLLQ